MSDLDRLTEPERRLRDHLQRTILPPPAPLSLASRVDELAEARVRAGRRPAPVAVALAFGRGGLRLALLAAAVVVVALLAGMLAWTRIDRDVANPHPTLPAFVGPALPTPAAQPTIVVDGAWIDASTAWLVDEANRLRMTVDGGQTWSGPRALPSATDLGLDFLDPAFGYTTWAREASGLLETPGSLDGLIAYRTDDGGRTWSPMRVGAVEHADDESIAATVHFTDRSHGVVLAAVVVPGEVAYQRCTGFVTDDGGATWDPLRDAPCLGTTWWVRGGLAGVVQPALDAPEVALSVDGGRSWRTGRLPGMGAGGTFWIEGVVHASGGGIRLLGAYHEPEMSEIPPLVVLETIDMGLTWEHALDTTLPEGGNARSIWAFDSDHWLALVTETGTSAPPVPNVLRETWDGGRTWQDAGSIAAIEGAWMRWADRLHGMVQGVDMGNCRLPGAEAGCGGTGTMFLTNDGGRSWHLVPF